MTAPVDICNFALMHLGVGQSIASLTEDSAEARACARVYDIARQSVLREHEWNFATRHIALSLVDDAPSHQGEYYYQYPTACLSAIAVKASNALQDGVNKTVFRVVHNEKTDSRNIVCALNPAFLEYIADVKNTSNFDPLFVEALAFRIAALVAFTLTGKRSLSENIMDLYSQSLASAKLADAKENHAQSLEDPEWIKAR